MSLRALLAGSPWPDPDELVRRFAAYGQTHGAWDDAAGYVKGSSRSATAFAEGAWRRRRAAYKSPLT